jgi:hypothetical protein
VWKKSYKYCNLAKLLSGVFFTRVSSTQEERERREGGRRERKKERAREERRANEGGQ